MIALSELKSIWLPFFEMYLGLVLTKYGKGTDTETAFERKIYYSVFGRKGHSMQGYMWKHQGRSDGRRSEGKEWAKASMKVFKGRNERGMVSS